MRVGDRVRLTTFNGARRWNERGEVYQPEDYWKLIGESGTIVQDPSEVSMYASFSDQPRVLVKFDKSVAAHGLICHNPVPNSLWILVTDLETIREGRGSAS